MLKNKKYSLSIINSTLLLIFLIVISIVISIWFYAYTQKSIESNIKDYFKQTYNLTQIILENEEKNLNNIAFEISSLISNDSESLKIIDEKMNNISSLDELDLIFLKDHEYFEDYSNSLFDTQSILDELKKSDMKENNNFMNVQVKGENYPLILKNKKIIDKKTGRVLYTLYIGKILNDNFAFVNSIKEKAQLKDVYLYFENQLISSSSTSVDLNMSIFKRKSIIKKGDYIYANKKFTIFDDKVLDLVFVSENSSFKIIKESFIESISFLVLFIVIVFTFLYLLSNRYIIKPFSELIDYANKMKNGKDITYKSSEVIEFDNFALNLKDIIEELKDVKEQYSSAIDGVQDGLWDINIKNNEVYCSNRYLSMIGYDDCDDAQSISFWREHIHKDDYKKTLKKLNKHLAKKTDLYEDEYRFRCKDGSYKWIKVRGKAFFENNIAYRITGFHTDINDVKLLQQDNNKKAQMLYQQSKLASMGEMISNIAHQWRQPLSLISTISSSLIVQIELGIFDNKDGKRDLEKVMRSVEYLSTIIEKFRNFFNPNNEKEAFSIDAIVRENLEIFETSYKSYNIEFILDLNQSDIIGYKFELIQVIINILNNAKDALLEKVNSENRRLIFMKCYKTNDNIIIKIYDNAGGINANLKKKIYEPYFTTKHQSQGTGLGLYMSNEIIKNHFKGELLNTTISYNYEEKKYKGEEFTITLPLST